MPLLDNLWRQNIMDMKSFIVLSIVLYQAISINITSTVEVIDEKSNESAIYDYRKLFITTPVQNAISKYLTREDLKTVTTINEMASFANSELNRRLRILHFRYGKIMPSTQEALNYLSRRNSIDMRHEEWVADTCILFGDKDPMNITGMLQNNLIIAIASRKDHLKVEWNFDKINEFASNDGEGTLINGMIYPCNCIPCGEFPMSCLPLEDIKFEQFILKIQIV
ncbi:unnamed protein product [Onchocerca flexuosa]|uniref:SCP domain-containing protein n=1 Tax=Onchocerca flexuosa TaxID=387005 RepID=A0A183HKW8_9BILA|nr:unnamed protein product [Onchocerca flexuosa]